MGATLGVRSIATSNAILKVIPLCTFVMLCDAADLSLAFLLGRLAVALVVAPDPISNHRESEFFKHVALTRSEVQQPTSQSIVVLSLLGRVVARGVLKVFFLVPQEIVFQFWILFPRELRVVKSREMVGEKTSRYHRIHGNWKSDSNTKELTFFRSVQRIIPDLVVSPTWLSRFLLPCFVPSSVRINGEEGIFLGATGPQS